MRFVNAPLSREDVSSLALGSVVSLSGPVITGRDEAHVRALEYLREGKPVPGCLYNSVLFHCGPIMVKGNGTWKAIAAGPTTSARMDRLEPEMIRRFGIRAIIGKGGMSREVCDAMKECGCVYLAATGGAAVSLAEALPRVSGVEWEDLGMAEAVWKFEADRLGPLIVAIDSKGESLYDRVSGSLVRT
ncbi:MAG: FumA C-terminus/TtdB family hydratase beta subunit [Candidatus Methanoplasma sp.]|jgi:fumarate hydratase subunit beta|nr:FumA C-terminus/TtdB family hydratase beta subunit [Candidatus Methanoplasma sp.]